MDPKQQIVQENAHPAIISMDEHIMAPEKMKQKGQNKCNGNERIFAHTAVYADCGKENDLP
ncbi:hypothetical protein QYF50_02185 [Paenibacillus vini]|uniref:hypothetical protein n=1 Tax=Paenibacillus vini TaxID=1476024 RepID=UPI0025B72C13|nr:hypothetical protein [Paenibacillus vini]MDN4066689.1 hypothetical protein [Paenibacillus vini]